VEFLDRAGIPYVDTLPALKRNVTRHLYTQSDRDMHPGKNGYGVIGEAVADFLQKRSVSAPVDTSVLPKEKTP
jgi:hypothetical protein